MEYSYSNSCYLAVAAHGGFFGIGTEGCCIQVRVNPDRLEIDKDTEGGCYVHSLCLRHGRQSALLLSNLARRRVRGSSPPGVWSPVEGLLYADGKKCY